jgi:hypothetical protein
MEPMHADRADALAALDDTALMVLFARGDAEAARLLTARLLPRALRHAARVLGDAAEAEDVAQEAMMRLWRAAPDWRATDRRSLRPGCTGWWRTSRWTGCDARGDRRGSTPRRPMRSPTRAPG